MSTRFTHPQRLTDPPGRAPAAVAGVAAEIARLDAQREFDAAAESFATVCPDVFAMAAAPGGSPVTRG